MDSKTVQRSALCRSRRELSNEYLLAKIGVDTAENELLEVWAKIQFIFHLPPYYMHEKYIYCSCRPKLRLCRWTGPRQLIIGQLVRVDRIALCFFAHSTC